MTDVYLLRVYIKVLRKVTDPQHTGLWDTVVSWLWQSLFCWASLLFEAIYIYIGISSTPYKELPQRLGTLHPNNQVDRAQC